ncbi:MAG TPA: TetR family transcriptional regulator, partial [Firmicutes bacterium]|nr:TetR family transcriptional regulator [Bacillota bacterium]
MDKREEKTLRSVYESFSILLKEKGYGKISAKDLIEKANISRSTFYAHFKSIKDVLSSF